MTLTAAEIEAHVSSESTEWATPRPLFERWDDIYHFTLDVCATPENAKCDAFFAKEDDGLAQDWTQDVCWMNPPYGDEIARWIRKAVDTALAGGLVVALLPAKTDTLYFHRYIWDRKRRCPRPWVRVLDFMKGRVRFRQPGKKKNTGLFASMVVVFARPEEKTCTE